MKTIIESAINNCPQAVSALARIRKVHLSVMKESLVMACMGLVSRSQDWRAVSGLKMPSDALLLSYMRGRGPLSAKLVEGANGATAWLLVAHAVLSVA